MPELLADPLPPMRVTPRQGLVRRVHHGPEVSQLLRAQHVRPRSLILGQSFASCGNPMKSSTHYGDSRSLASPRRNHYEGVPYPRGGGVGRGLGVGVALGAGVPVGVAVAVAVAVVVGVGVGVGVTCGQLKISIEANGVSPSIS